MSSARTAARPGVPRKNPLRAARMPRGAALPDALACFPQFGAAELGILSRRGSQLGAGGVPAALALLHARACRTALEAHAPLAAGFPAGAYGRYRTLHELDVFTALIAEYGSRPEHHDLAVRYIASTKHARTTCPSCSACLA